MTPLVMCLSAGLLGQASLPIVASAANWQVHNCDDSGTDSLRDVIENPMKAQSGDTVDLSHVPQLCGMHASTIALSGGEIVVHQDTLTLLGPADGSVTISGNGTNRVFRHTGTGIFQIKSLLMTEGYFHSNGDAYGGCIDSEIGDIFLESAVVSGCIVKSDTGFAKGGGVSAGAGNVTLMLSVISENQANAPGKAGGGGGIYSFDKTWVKYSAIVGNAEEGSDSWGGGYGGGILAAFGGAVVRESTIAGNTGAVGSGIETGGPLEITNSTISGNIASVHAAVAIYTTAASATISNSTIAFNHEASARGAVTFSTPTATAKLTLQSSILANNTDSMNTPADLYIWLGHGILDPAGADNLIVASNVASPPPGVITLTSDPMLGPLQLNGSVTATHMPMPGSPVLGTGNNNAAVTMDQRGRGYPRMTGAHVDIGAVQFDTIFVGDFDIDI